MGKNTRRQSSTRRVLEPLFGRYWPLALVTVPAIVSWPAFVFRAAVDFDPAHFVEEWIKISITTFLFYIVVEVVQEKKRTELSRRDFFSFFASHALQPLETGIRTLESVASSLAPGVIRDVSDELLTACRHVEHAASALVSVATLQTDLLYLSKTLAPVAAQLNDCNATIVQLARTREWGVAILDDIESTIATLRATLGDLTESAGETNDPS